MRADRVALLRADSLQQHVCPRARPERVDALDVCVRELDPLHAQPPACTPLGRRAALDARELVQRDPVQPRGCAITALGKGFSDCTSYEFELLAYDVVGDMAYTASFEHTSASVDGQPRTYTLRATQVYRREEGEWRVAHRHADTVTG